MARKKAPKKPATFSTPLAQEKLYSIAQIVRVLPIERTRWCIQDWITRGSCVKRDKDAPRVKLEAVPIQGVYHTSLEAYQRFITALVFAASTS